MGLGREFKAILKDSSSYLKSIQSVFFGSEVSEILHAL